MPGFFGNQAERLTRKYWRGDADGLALELKNMFNSRVPLVSDVPVTLIRRQGATGPPLRIIDENDSPTDGGLIVVQNTDGSTHDYCACPDEDDDDGGGGGGGGDTPPDEEEEEEECTCLEDIITGDDGNPPPKRCFQGQITVRINKPPPDPFGWDGTTPTFAGVLCWPYAPPRIPAPWTALITTLKEPLPLPFGRGSIPAGVTLWNVVRIYCSEVVGLPSTATVTRDKVSEPGEACTGIPCAAPTPNNDGNGVGTVI